MNCPEALDRLDDYLADALPASERRDVEEHLATCAGCHRELASLGALLDTAHDLRNRSFEPERDLWPGIERRIRTEASRRVPSWRSRLGLGGRGLALSLAGAATIALALVAVREGGFPASSGRSGTPAGRPVPEAAAGFGEQAAALDTQVRAARQEVSGAVGAGSEPAAAEGSWAVFDQNLQVLDRAIRESRAALERDPENPRLQKSLLGAYQKQLELLRWASRLMPQG